MPKANWKDIAEANKFEPMEMGSEELRRPSVYLDVTPEQASGIDVDDEVVITIKGIARMVRKEKNHNSVEVDITTQELYKDEENEFEKLSYEDED